MTRRWVMMMVALCVIAVCSGQCCAALQREGTTLDELVALGLPHPSQTSIAVLPFAAPIKGKGELARGSLLFLCKKHGFKILPDVESLSAVARRTDKVLENVPVGEPGTGIGRQRARALGEAVGADWVIYGEINELHTVTHKRFFRTRKVGSIDIRMVVLDVASGDILCWERLHDVGSGGSGVARAKGSAIERKLTLRTVQHFFSQFARALPEHETGQPVGDEAVLEFVSELGY